MMRSLDGSSRFPSRRAMTLIEVMVTVSLLVVVTGAMMYLLTIVKGRWVSGASRASVRQDMQTTLWQMATEIRNTEAALVTVNSQASPAAFCFPSAYDAQNNFITDPAGGMTWQKFVIYYIPAGTTRLLRKEVYSLPATPPIQLTEAAMLGYCDGTGSLVAGDVGAMTATIDIPNGGLTLGLTTTGTSGKGTVDTVSSSLYLETRN